MLPWAATGAAEEGEGLGDPPTMAAAGALLPWESKVGTKPLPPFCWLNPAGAGPGGTLGPRCGPDPPRLERSNGSPISTTPAVAAAAIIGREIRPGLATRSTPAAGTSSTTASDSAAVSATCSGTAGA